MLIRIRITVCLIDNYHIFIKYIKGETTTNALHFTYHRMYHIRSQPTMSAHNPQAPEQFPHTGETGSNSVDGLFYQYEGVMRRSNSGGAAQKKSFCVKKSKKSWSIRCALNLPDSSLKQANRNKDANTKIATNKAVMTPQSSTSNRFINPDYPLEQPEQTKIVLGANGAKNSGKGLIRSRGCFAAAIGRNSTAPNENDRCSEYASYCSDYNYECDIAIQNQRKTCCPVSRKNGMERNTILKYKLIDDKDDDDNHNVIVKHQRGKKKCCYTLTKVHSELELGNRISGLSSLSPICKRSEKRQSNGTELDSSNEIEEEVKGQNKYAQLDVRGLINECGTDVTEHDRNDACNGKKMKLELCMKSVQPSPRILNQSTYVKPNRALRSGMRSKCNPKSRQDLMERRSKIPDLEIITTEPKYCSRFTKQMECGELEFGRNRNIPDAQHSANDGSAVTSTANMTHLTQTTSTSIEIAQCVSDVLEQSLASNKMAIVASEILIQEEHITAKSNKTSLLGQKKLIRNTKRNLCIQNSDSNQASRVQTMKQQSHPTFAITDENDVLGQCTSSSSQDGKDTRFIERAKPYHPAREQFTKQSSDSNSNKTCFLRSHKYTKRIKQNDFQSHQSMNLSYDVEDTLQTSCESTESATCHLKLQASNNGGSSNAVEGLIAASNGDYSKAMNVFQAILKTCITTKGEVNALVASTHHNIGILHVKQSTKMATVMSRDECQLKSLQSFKKAVYISREVFGENHPNVALSLVRIGFLLLDRGEYENALETFYRALFIRKNCLGKHHPLVAKIYNNLGVTNLHLQYYEEGLKSFENALDIQRIVYKTSLNNLTDGAGQRNKKVSQNMLKVGDTLCNIALVCMDWVKANDNSGGLKKRGSYVQIATDSAVEALSIRSRILDPDDHQINQTKVMFNQAKNLSGSMKIDARKYVINENSDNIVDMEVLKMFKEGKDSILPHSGNANQNKSNGDNILATDRKLIQKSTIQRVQCIDQDEDVADKKSKLKNTQVYTDNLSRKKDRKQFKVQSKINGSVSITPHFIPRYLQPIHDISSISTPSNASSRILFGSTKELNISNLSMRKCHSVDSLTLNEESTEDFIAIGYTEESCLILSSELRQSGSFPWDETSSILFDENLDHKNIVAHPIAVDSSDRQNANTASNRRPPLSVLRNNLLQSKEDTNMITTSKLGSSFSLPRMPKSTKKNLATKDSKVIYNSPSSRMSRECYDKENICYLLPNINTDLAYQQTQNISGILGTRSIKNKSTHSISSELNSLSLSPVCYDENKNKFEESIKVRNAVVMGNLKMLEPLNSKDSLNNAEQDTTISLPASNNEKIKRKPIMLANSTTASTESEIYRHSQSDQSCKVCTIDTEFDKNGLDAKSRALSTSTEGRGEKSGKSVSSSDTPHTSQFQVDLSTGIHDTKLTLTACSAYVGDGLALPELPKRGLKNINTNLSKERESLILSEPENYIQELHDVGAFHLKVSYNKSKI